MENEKIQEIWNSTNGLLSDNEMSEFMSRTRLTRRITALEKLQRQYRKFSIIGFVMAGISPLWLHSTIVIHDRRIILVAVMACYFITAAIMDLILCRKIGEIDVLTMPVGKVASLARACRRFHHRCMAVLIPFAIIIVGTIIYALGANVYIIAGVSSGLIIGVGIGLNVYFRMMRSYRDIEE